MVGSIGSEFQQNSCLDKYFRFSKDIIHDGVAFSTKLQVSTCNFLKMHSIAEASNKLFCQTAHDGCSCQSHSETRSKDIFVPRPFFQWNLLTTFEIKNNNKHIRRKQHKNQQDEIIPFDKARQNISRKI